MTSKIIFSILTIMLLISVTVFVINSGAARPTKRENFEIIAHRGVHQIFVGSDLGLQRDKSYLTVCEADRIVKPTHEYLENTIESIQAAFESGATMVEIDIRPTKDNQLVVFHDWMLDCRTNGQGNVIDHTVAELKTLDIGHGYTFDGRTYPFRGKGFGQIKTLTEIVNHFPDSKFLIDNKNGDSLEVAQLIVDTLSQLPDDQQQLLHLWCEDKAYAYIHQRLPLVTRLILPRNHQKRFFKSYIAKLGFGNIPEQYMNQGIGLPTKYIKYIWGWPNRFLGKVYDADMRFYLYINTVEEVHQYVQPAVLNGIVTDHIEIIGKYFRRQTTEDG